MVAIVVLLVINGFFVAAEFALVKAKGFRIETLAIRKAEPVALPPVSG